MRFSWKGWFVIALAVGLLLVMAILRVRRSERVPLPNGNELAITDVKLGDTNVFTHGTWMDKTVGTHLGTNIALLKLFNITVQKPEIVRQYAWRESSPFLSVELQLMGTNSVGDELLKPSFYRSCRLIHWGDDGYKYFEEPLRFMKYLGILTHLRFRGSPGSFI